MQPSGGPSGSSRGSPASSPHPDQQQPPTPASAQQQAQQLGFRGQVGLALSVPPTAVLGSALLDSNLFWWWWWWWWCGFFFRTWGQRDWWETVRALGFAKKAACLRGLPLTAVFSPGVRSAFRCLVFAPLLFFAWSEFH